MPPSTAGSAPGACSSRLGPAARARTSSAKGLTRNRRRSTPATASPPNGSGASCCHHRSPAIPHAPPDTLFTPGSDPHARHDRKQRADSRRDPPSIERVLEEEPGRREERQHADDEQSALAEPLLEVRDARLGGRGAQRDLDGLWRTGARRGRGDRRCRRGLGSSGRGEQAAHHVLEDFDPSLEPLDRLPLFVTHETALGGAEREPRAVMTIVTAATIRRSGTHPTSVLGKTIWTKFIAKSKAPMSNPSSTVPWRPRPQWANKLPVTRATAPCPAASRAVVRMSLTRVWTSQDFPGL